MVGAGRFERKTRVFAAIAPSFVLAGFGMVKDPDWVVKVT
jgi:hypothetical protein